VSLSLLLIFNHTLRIHHNVGQLNGKILSVGFIN